MPTKFIWQNYKLKSKYILYMYVAIVEINN